MFMSYTGLFLKVLQFFYIQMLHNCHYNLYSNQLATCRFIIWQIDICIASEEVTKTGIGHLKLL